MPRTLVLAARLELLSLFLLLANLATVHWRPITSLAGPIHGCAYLIVVILAFATPAIPRTSRLLSLIPGVGGLLAIRSSRPA